jgi:hypothetical protein
MTRRNNWLDTHIASCETLLTELYLERDARLERQLEEPQVAETMAKLKASVSARRRYENTVKTDPALLEAHRKRARESWRRKQQAAQHETKGPEPEATQQAAVAKKLSFTLKV